MVVNRQSAVPTSISSLRGFVRRLKSELGINGHDFDVTLVDDSEIARVNGEFRGKPHPTDVLSFPWGNRPEIGKTKADREKSTFDFELFLGDILISAPAARRNAREEGHSTANELRWLVLHGTLHLLGFDHTTDSGEMTARELDLRARLGIAQAGARPRRPGGEQHRQRSQKVQTSGASA